MASMSDANESKAAPEHVEETHPKEKRVTKHINAKAVVKPNLATKPKMGGGYTCNM
jgi:hypothetical protein